MKKTIVWFTLISLIVTSLVLSSATAQNESTLVVGSTTRLSGAFFTEMWGNNTVDIDIRELLHEYPTVIWTEEGELITNPTVVQALGQVEDAGGNVVLTIDLKPGLRFSDGTPVTAADYVFSVLLETSPLIAQLGGQALVKSFILGADEYASGQGSTITGLRLLGELQYSVTVRKDALPYFYELSYAHAQPYPIGAIAPGCEVVDDGEGVYIRGPFTTELLHETILNPKTGYLSHPSIVSGPYMLLSFDLDRTRAELALNPYYNGNHEGVKPTIQRLVFIETKNDTMLEELRSDKIGLINKISSGEVIDRLPAMQAAGIANSIGYPRAGMGFLAFATEQGFGSSILLRKAIAHLINKDVIVRDFLHGHGEPVYGYYGIGQWMVRSRKDELGQLNVYPYSIESAAELLDQDGWTLDRNGARYSEGAGQRYRKVGELLLPLKLTMGISPDNAAANLAADLLRDGLQRVGGKLTVETIPLTQLLEHHYRQQDRTFDLLFLGSNFSSIFDPYYNYNPDIAFHGVYNTSGLRDDELFRLATVMRETPSGNRNLYLNRWLDFQKGWVQALPMVPLYSNTYYDAFSPKLINYDPGKHMSWSNAIIYARIE